MTRLRDRAEMAALDAALALVRAPSYPAAVNACGRIGRRLLPLLPQARRARDNLAHVWPDKPETERAALLAEIGAQHGRLVAEYARLDDLAGRAPRWRVAGLEHLEAARARGRGVIVVSAHIGNWEALRAAAQAAGAELAMIRRGFRNRLFDARSRAVQAPLGGPILDRGRDGSRAMMRLLGGGGLMLVLLDQRLGDGATLPFLGQPAATNLAAAALARRLGTPMLTARALRLPDGLDFDIRFEPALPQGDDVETMLAYHARVAAWVEAAPAQWFWLHRRWKRPGPAA